MDLVSSIKKIVVLMSLSDKNNKMKFRKEATIPLTGSKCVSLLITELAVFEFTSNGVILKEIAKGHTIEEI